MKSENLAICFAMVIEQVVKLSSDQHNANKRLYEMYTCLLIRGKHMGTRMCDEFNAR